MLKVYSSKFFAHAHEEAFAEELTTNLKTHFDDNLNENAILLFNFLDIDAVLIKAHAIIAIDFKNYGGALSHAQMDGDWKINIETTVKGGAACNPFQQLKANKFKLLEKFKTFVPESNNLGHISAMVIFQEEVGNLKAVNSYFCENKAMWFKVTDVNSYWRALLQQRSEKINLSNEDFENLPKNLNIASKLNYQSEAAERSELEKIQQELRIANVTIAEKESRVAEYSNTLQDVKTQREAYKQKANEAQNSNETLQTQVNDVTTNNEKLQTQVSVLQEENKTLCQEVATLKAQIEDFKLRLTNFSNAQSRVSLANIGYAAVLLVVGLSVGILCFKPSVSEAAVPQNSFVEKPKDSTKIITPSLATEDTTLATKKTLLLVNNIGSREIKLRTTPNTSGQFITVTSGTLVDFISKSDTKSSINLNGKIVLDYWYQVRLGEEERWVFGHYVNR